MATSASSRKRRFRLLPMPKRRVAFIQPSPLRHSPTRPTHPPPLAARRAYLSEPVYAQSNRRTRPWVDGRWGTAAPTRLQTGNFFLGRFQVVQARPLKGQTDLVIQDKLKRSVCGAQGQQASAAKLSARVLGLLRGKAKGHFRTRGHFAAATV